ncbi:MAG: hypothetical protein OHK0026_10250 [Rhodocyclaceae bacterium]
MNANAVEPHARNARAAAGKGKRVARFRAGKAATASGTAPGAAVDPGQRRRMIATSAYFRAERRGFAGGSALEDWLDAEAEVDRMLERSGEAGEALTPRAVRPQ